MNDKKILLIGGTGYIGIALYEKLKKNYMVHICGNEEVYESNQDFSFLNLNDEEKIEEVLIRDSYDIIIILAAKVKIEYKNGIDLNDELFKVNVFGLNKLLLKLINLSLNSNLIYISTMTVYDKNAHNPVSEDSFLNPLHTYGVSKVLAEKIFSYYVHKYNCSGVIFRLPGVYGGKREGGYIYNIIKKLKNNEDITIDSTNLGYWETINIDDLNEMFYEFIENYEFKQKFNIFNLSYGEETDFIETVYDLKDLTNSNSSIIIKNRDYQKFFLDNKKISQFVSIHKYSYLKSLKRYIEELK